MPAPPVRPYYENAGGQLLPHPAGYIVLRYLAASKRQPGDIANLLTNLGRLLLAHGWHRFLADNRQMTPLDAAEKAWFTTNWLGARVARPVPLWGAIVLPTEVVARLSITQMLTAADPTSLIYRSFVEVSQAEAYLAALPAPRR